MVCYRPRGYLPARNSLATRQLLRRDPVVEGLKGILLGFTGDAVRLCRHFRLNTRRHLKPLHVPVEQAFKLMVELSRYKLLARLQEIAIAINLPEGRI